MKLLLFIIQELSQAVPEIKMEIFSSSHNKKRNSKKMKTSLLILTLTLTSVLSSDPLASTGITVHDKVDTKGNSRSFINGRYQTGRASGNDRADVRGERAVRGSGSCGGEEV